MFSLLESKRLTSSVGAEEGVVLTSCFTSALTAAGWWTFPAGNVPAACAASSEFAIFMSSLPRCPAFAFAGHLGNHLCYALVWLRNTTLKSRPGLFSDAVSPVWHTLFFFFCKGYVDLHWLRRVVCSNHMIVKCHDTLISILLVCSFITFHMVWQALVNQIFQLSKIEKARLSCLLLKLVGSF